MNRHTAIRTAGISVFAMAVAALAGCSGSTQDNATGTGGATGGAGSGDALEIMFITNAQPGDSFWAPVEKGAEDAAAALGAKLTYEPAPTVDQQVSLINAAVAQHVGGIMVQGESPDAEAAPLKAAEAAGIPVVIVSAGTSQFAQMGALTGVGQDDALGGQAAGDQFNTLGKSKVVCVIHEQNSIQEQQRCGGLKDTFKGTVATLQVPGTGDISGSEAAIKAQLAADPTIDGVLTLSPIIGEAAAQAVKEANSSAALGTFDLTTQILSDLKDGTASFAIDQQPYLQGYMPVVIINLHAKTGLTVGGGQPVYTGPQIVTKDNADAFGQLMTQGIGG